MKNKIRYSGILVLIHASFRICQLTNYLCMTYSSMTYVHVHGRLRAHFVQRAGALRDSASRVKTV